MRAKVRFYLSSYKIGNEPEKLKALLPAGNRKIGYIPNALDYSTDAARYAWHVEADMDSLRAIGLDPEVLDLKKYFGKKIDLETKLAGLGGLWISGGNTFVLRQAMRLCGLDEVLMERSLRNNFLYAGYSAAGCVLSPSLKAYQTVDDPTSLPYAECREIIWEGLGLIDYAFMPHFNSDHGESKDIDKEIEYCKSNNIPFKAVRDGDAIIIE